MDATAKRYRDGTDVADYQCVVSNANGSTYSNQASLTLAPLTTITDQP